MGLTAFAAAGRARTLGSPGEPGRLRQRAALLFEIFGTLTMLHGIRVQVRGRIPRGPALLAANHLSYIDPVAVGSLLPCVPVSKIEVSGWPVVGAFARRLGVLFVDRSSRGSGTRVAWEAARALREGLPVLNFPEGTTTAGNGVLPFRAGLFGVARRAGVPVLPIHLAYEPVRAAWIGADTFLPHYLRIAGESEVLARVSFGDPILPETCSSATGLAEAARTRVTELAGSAHVPAASS